MDRIDKYRAAIISVTDSVMDHYRTDATYEVFDLFPDKTGHYLCIIDGWSDLGKRSYGTIVHIELKEDGKVWLRRDSTDKDIGGRLIEAGVEKSDLVLAFRAPERRALSEFAVS